MKSFTIPLHSHHHTDRVKITREVQKAVTESVVKDGVCTIFSPHN